ncbi:MAG: hypothetical protein JW966_01240 [Anaerolineae bacterium]|nr:hypothetical protein [Anaerolineae bacterium]
MAKSPSPELVQALQLVKAGNRREAGEVLKVYLSQHAQDVDGWWLMAHIVSRPDRVQKCLERVLSLDPNHAKARKKLDELLTPPGDEPDDEFFVVATGAPSAPPAASSPAIVPLSAPAGAAPDVEPFDPSADYSNDVPYDPFAGIVDSPSIIDTFAQQSGEAQAAGTGSQPQWGPGLGFIPDHADPLRPAPPKPKGRGSTRASLNAIAEEEPVDYMHMLRPVFVVVGVIVVFIIGLFVANMTGVVHLWGPLPMTTLESDTFEIDYPVSWDKRCEPERSGYPVCGIANHNAYNQVDWYAGQDINLGALVSDLGFGLLGGYRNLPDTQVSIIVMNVPPNSSAYDDASWARTKDKWHDEGWLCDSIKATETYNRETMTIDGREAWYYEYKCEDSVEEDQGWRGLDYAYDIYIPQDNGLMFWMTVQVRANIGDKTYDDTIRKMIKSINITEG